MRQPHEVLDTWMRKGRAQPIPEGVREHLRSCADCRDVLDEADEVRSWFERGEDVLSTEAASAIRFRLEREARNPSASQTTVTPVRRLGLGVLLCGLLVLALGYVVTGASTKPETRSAVSIPLAMATPTAEEDAVFFQLKPAPDELYELRSGRVQFQVRPLSDRHRVRVVVGHAIAEVRGTAFELVAAEGVLQKVRVTEGVVALRLEASAKRAAADNRVPVILRAGDEWTRPVERAPRIEEPAPKPPKPRTRRGPTKVEAPPSDERPAAESRPHVPSPEPPKRLDHGEAFHAAWLLSRAGDHEGAAAAFDVLLEKSGEAEAEHRAEILYWAARSHHAAGRPGTAKARAETSLRVAPTGWHADRARALLERLRRSEDVNPD